MDRIIRSQILTARKTYNCDACYWWDRCNMSENDCETDMQRHIVRESEKDGWKILPGQKYRKVVGIHDGKIATCRVRLDMDDLCTELDVYP